MRCDFNMELLKQLISTPVSQLNDGEVLEMVDMMDQCIDMTARILMKMGKQKEACSLWHTEHELIQPVCDIAFLNSEISPSDFRLVN